MKTNSASTMLGRLLAAAAIAIFAIAGARAQTTVFTFQGKLNDGGLAANANYDMQFKLFPNAAGGVQNGPTVTVPTVIVTSGIFTVRLDFGAVFDGTDRFLEIGVRPAGSNAAFTLLSPRVPVTSAPYTVQSLAATSARTSDDSAKLGGVVAANYVLTSDPRLSDARTPTAGSSDYIQNGNAVQPAANFNIDGNGTVGGTLDANTVNSASGFKIGGDFFLKTAGTFNTFVGRNVGAANTSGVQNTYLGALTGIVNTTGSFNTFAGVGAGAANVVGDRNSFFGNGAGQSTNANFNSFFGNAAGFNNTTGTSNSFFGFESGQRTDVGTENSFFGNRAGFVNTSGSKNSALGSLAGPNSSTGSNNIFIGFNAGRSNTTENDNIFIGSGANGAIGITNATAIGTNAVVSTSNAMTLGTNLVSVEVPGNLTVLGTLTANLPSGSSNYIQNSTSAQANADFNVAGTGRVGGTFSATKIGVGTNTPLGALDIRGGNTSLNYNLLQFGPGSDDSQAILYTNTVDGLEFRGFGGFRWKTGLNGVDEIMRLTAGGLLGLGTNTPSQRLTVVGNGLFTGGVLGATVSVSGSYQINGARLLTANQGANSTILGTDSGGALAGGIQNTFLGSLTGNATTTGNYNSFAGTGAGLANTTGSQNSYFGNGAGQNSVSADGNSFFGYGAGFQTTTGSNSFFGNRSGFGATTGFSNSFFGAGTGESTTGNENSFFGNSSGFANTSGFSNAFFGATSGQSNTSGNHNSFLGYGTGASNTTGKNNTFVGWLSGLSATTEDFNTLLGANTNLTPGIVHSTAIGADVTVTQSHQIVLGSLLDSVKLGSVGGGGSTNLCVNNVNVILTCSSSLRYKTNLAPYTRSLDVISKLRPISFDWKDGGRRDVGFGAEDVAKIDPLLVSYNGKGEVEGVKYDRLSTVFVNAFREQQAEIIKQQELIDSQKTRLAAQDAAIAALARRVEELGKRVDRTVSLRRPASRRRGIQTKSRR